MNLSWYNLHSYYKGAPINVERGMLVEDKELIERCQRGDAAGFSQIYSLYGKNALGTAYLISGHKGIAEDIVQETFIQCFLCIKKLQTPEAFDVWFYKILLRTGRRMVKRHNQVISVGDRNIEDFSAESGSDSGIHRSEIRMEVRNALDKLSLPLKTVAILYYYNDMTVEEIAKVLGCFSGTVKSRLHNARKKLYGELNGVFYDNQEEGFNIL